MSIPIVVFTNQVINTLQASFNLNMLIRVHISFSNHRPYLRIQSELRKVGHLRPTLRHVLRRVLHVIKIINRPRNLAVRHISNKRNRLLRADTLDHRKFPNFNQRPNVRYYFTYHRGSPF